LKAWHAPGPLTVSLVEVDLRVGGAFRLHMRAPDGKEHRASGVYRQVDPPNKVVYTWEWDGNDSAKDSVVTIELHERGDATEVVLTHSGIAGAKDRADHEKGWTQIMD